MEKSEELYKSVCKDYVASCEREMLLENDEHIIHFLIDDEFIDKKQEINIDNYKNYVYDECEDEYSSYKELYEVTVKEAIIQDINDLGIFNEEGWNFYISYEDLYNLDILPTEYKVLNEEHDYQLKIYKSFDTEKENDGLKKENLLNTFKARTGKKFLELFKKLSEKYEGYGYESFVNDKFLAGGTLDPTDIEFLPNSILKLEKSEHKRFKLSEILETLEFDYTFNENGNIQLIDTTGANLGDIENEEFYSPEDVLARLDNYTNDYWFNDLEEKVSEQGIETKNLSYNAILEIANSMNLVDKSCYDEMYAILNPELIEKELDELETVPVNDLTLESVSKLESIRETSEKTQGNEKER